MIFLETFALASAETAILVTVAFAGSIFLSELRGSSTLNRVVLFGSMAWIIIGIGLIAAIVQTAQ